MSDAPADDAGAAPRVVYSSSVTRIGAQVQAFLDHGILILFADNAPEELHDLAVLHAVEVGDDGPAPGDTLRLGDTEWPVLAVGGVVRDNLLNLGHMDIKADGRTDAKLPGDVCVPQGALPMLTAGAALSIERPA